MNFFRFKSYSFEILSFLSGLYQKKPPRQGEKISLKIHRADLRGREICPTGRLFLYRELLLRRSSLYKKSVGALYRPRFFVTLF